MRQGECQNRRHISRRQINSALRLAASSFIGDRVVVRCTEPGVACWFVEEEFWSGVMSNVGGNPFSTRGYG
ncbi:hypothetical protein C2S51_032057 [Perilla frutescens var. frutescens]|nr:hypothetical protein C2S51_032057 [Perilla frutescens var. frutescens]